MKSFGRKTAAIIRHVHFEDLGTIKDALDAHDYEIKYYEAGIDNLTAIKDTKADLLVVLGGPISANDEEQYPFLRNIINLMKERIEADAPTLGICLGAQLLARALGTKVYPGATKEIGWTPLTLTEEGKASPLLHLSGQRTSMLHWHGDIFDLPAEAKLLASTPKNTNQAFRYGQNILAFQCHPELKALNFEAWLIGHACEISQTPNVTVEDLRSDTRQYGEVLEAAARRTFGEWIKSLPKFERGLTP